MRILAIGLLVVLGAGCGSSPKPRVPQLGSTPSPDRIADATPTELDRGDVILATTTGDDLSWLGPIYFELDSTNLSVQARETLVKLHEWMTVHSKVALAIEGHCDERGTTEYNIALGQRRAQNMTDYLVRLGTDVKRLHPTSFGSERPAVEGHDEVAWSKNRRGEMRVGP